MERVHFAQLLTGFLPLDGRAFIEIRTQLSSPRYNEQGTRAIAIIVQDFIRTGTCDSGG